MTEPKLYRRPPDPGGYIGGYNWGPALGGLGLLILTNFVATQLVAHQFAYQSAAMTPDPWLGPDAGEVIAGLARDGQRNVLIAPVGFVCEHVEILYDVDVVFKRQAEALGMHLQRIEMLNTAPAMIAGLAGLVRERAAGAGWL